MNSTSWYRSPNYLPTAGFTGQHRLVFFSSTVLHPRDVRGHTYSRIKRRICGSRTSKRRQVKSERSPADTPCSGFGDGRGWAHPPRASPPLNGYSPAARSNSIAQSATLLGAGAQSADLAHFVHHQTRERFDVLRSKPMELASAQRMYGESVDAIHRVASKYYRLIFIDSGNDESDPMWQRMIDHTDQLVVATTTRDDHAEAGALLLEALADRDEKAQAHAQKAFAVVTQADSKATFADVKRVADGYQMLARDVASIPFDPAIVDGILRYDALRPATQRAWLAAGAAVARGL